MTAELASPFFRYGDAVLRGTIVDPMAVTMDYGFAVMVWSWVSFFDRSDHAAKVMECARRAGIPYKEARERWSDPDDLAAEFGYDIWLSAAAWESCPSCGIKPNDMLDPDSKRPLRRPRYMIEKQYCFACSELKHANDDLTDAEKESGAFIRLVPYRPHDGPRGHLNIRQSRGRRR